jgi:hypothetical protein
MSRPGDGCVAGGGRNPTRDSRLVFRLAHFNVVFAQLDDWVAVVVAISAGLLVSLSLFVTLLTV